jgi:hypothetical protein
MAAFKTYQQELTLEINQKVEINASLEVGSQTDKVTVTAEAPPIQTEDSSVGLVIDSATIVNTPLNGRLNITGLMALAPGIQNAGAQDSIPVFGITPSVGGASAYGSTAFSIDGATNTSAFLQRGYGEYPPLDGIREFKTITTGAPAEFTQPTQVVVVTRGGTNRYHGTLLAFNRNRFTAAKNYFNGALPLPKYNRNEFGGNFSGPISIPHLYNGRDRSFFFFNYEGFRRRQAFPLSSQMPTALERTGDFSEFSTQIIDPITQTPFANNKIPPSKLNSVSVALQNALFPLPNRSGTSTNLFENVPLAENVDRYSFRLDHRLTSQDTLFATYIASLFGPNPSVATTGTSKFGGMAGIGERNMNTIVGWSHIFSPTLLTQFIGSYITCLSSARRRTWAPTSLPSFRASGLNHWRARRSSPSPTSLRLPSRARGTSTRHSSSASPLPRSCTTTASRPVSTSCAPTTGTRRCWLRSEGHTISTASTRA